MKPIAPNTLIQNRYLIVHLIGKGGMGEVYLAVDQRLGSAIALKRTFFSDDATLGNAFEREARTLARLRHPVLPKVSDHFTEEGTQYLVMEHISGEDISKRLEGMDKPFPLSWVLFWADQLLDALTYLHTHEPPIIHRDIKPQNLKLTDENHIVLLDFGLSKNTMGETRATTTGSIVGYTPHYAPMEQIRGTGTDARSDIYSLSATLYQILTNAVPPDALTRADSLINGMPDPIQPISDLNAEVSRAVSDVIVKGMSISQEQRYKTAREMQKCLRDAFAQLQTDMSANNIAVVPESQPKISQSQQKTEVIPYISGTSRTPQESAPEAKKSEVFAVQTDSSSLVSKKSNGSEPDFDATIRYDEDLKNSPKQSDIQTEVLLAGSSDAITAAQKGHFDKIDNSPKIDDFHKSENFSLDESFTGNGKFEPAENYSPDATVPLFTFDNDLAGAAQSSNTAAFTSRVGENENKSSTGATFVPSAEATSDREDHSPTPVLAAKKSGKGLAIGGGLAALLFLAVAAAGIGWYTLRDTGGTTENVTPTPSPETTATVEPSVAPTLEVVSETNSSTNSDVTNSETNTSTDSDVVNSETNVSTNANVKVTNVNPVRPPQTAPPTPIKVPPSVAPPRSTTQTGSVKPPTPIKPPTPTKPPKIIIVQ